MLRTTTKPSFLLPLKLRIWKSHKVKTTRWSVGKLSTMLVLVRHIHTHTQRKYTQQNERKREAKITCQCKHPNHKTSPLNRSKITKPLKMWFETSHKSLPSPPPLPYCFFFFQPHCRSLLVLTLLLTTSSAFCILFNSTLCSSWIWVSSLWCLLIISFTCSS